MISSSRQAGPKDTDAFKLYLERRSPVIQGVEDRIRIYKGDHVDYLFYAASTAAAGKPAGSEILRNYCMLILTTVFCLKDSFF